MKQHAILSQMFDFSIVCTTKGSIVQFFTNNNMYQEKLKLHKTIGSFEKELFQNSIFPTYKSSTNKQSFLQKTWFNHRVLTYVIPSEDELFFGYNILEHDTLEVSQDSKSLDTSFIIKSNAMKKVAVQIKKAAKAGATTLLLGESGVGKEMAARAIYNARLTKDQPFVAINCGALPETLIESELFGYKAGSFTGADKAGKIGKFREANNGVLFLDEIAELPLSMQVKLLRVLQERVVTPIGSSEEFPIDIQIVAATNQSLINMVHEGKFREDLYYRLNIIPISIPPLRDRVSEIPELIEHFTAVFNSKYASTRQFTIEAIDFLSLQEWPGNVRELENFIERIIILSDDDIISIQQTRKFLDPPSSNQQSDNKISFKALIPLQEAQELVEEQLIMMAMKKYNSLKLAANVLGISQPTMSRKYKKFKENSVNIFSTRTILENELNKRLRSTAVVASVTISPKILEDAVYNPHNPEFLLPLSEQLTQIYTREDDVEWGFIFYKDAHGNIINLTSSADFVIPVGAIYYGSDIIKETIFNAYEGIISVSPIYDDEYGSWKTCCAPLYDTKGKIVAILGFDYSREYVENALINLSKSLNITLT